MSGDAQVAGVAECVETVARGEEGVEAGFVLGHFFLRLLLLRWLLLLLGLLLEVTEGRWGLLLLGLEGSERLLLWEAAERVC